ncbi:DinB family protein [Aeromonas enteropelogenes]|uniref:DinB family protein n=1 Tax=Aeromonas enteropelogenes TaxID=29489 RepID=UPI001CCF6E5B|nr:DinB family protein [Aeromonas enteropelogenes]UBH28275.1 DinB family protein [Aeromonas enteropelogenes]
MPLFTTLLAMPDQFEQLLAQVPADHLDWEPVNWAGIPSERFSARGHLCHLLDIETLGYQVRFRRTLEESLPALASLDGYQLAQDNQYRQQEPAEQLARFRTARSETVDWLKAQPASAWQRRARYGGYGEVTLDGLVRLLVSHDLQHLAGMQWLLMRLNADLRLAIPLA